MAELTRSEVAHVAKLARLTLSDEELDLFTVQLGKILIHAQDMSALDLSELLPTAHPFGLVNVLRADEVRPRLPLYLQRGLLPEHGRAQRVPGRPVTGRRARAPPPGTAGLPSGASHACSNGITEGRKDGRTVNTGFSGGKSGAGPDRAAAKKIPRGKSFCPSWVTAPETGKRIFSRETGRRPGIRRRRE